MDESACGYHVPKGLIAAELRSAACTATGQYEQKRRQYRCRQQLWPDYGSKALILVQK